MIRNYNNSFMAKILRKEIIIKSKLNSKFTKSDTSLN